ncbi:MAG: DUF1853 family protein [Crocinitomicaceae bacterium]|nr:DUF1853 family protein [Crocinitomicaceae bacterium]MDG1777249.1 DUF1853 family protein [Crocinitomicaceae bacterium]
METTEHSLSNIDGQEIIKRQLDGYLATETLWKGTDLAGLKQLEFEHRTHSINIEKPEKRLGKRAEQFFIELIKKTRECKLVSQNIQLKSGKITIGEIDCILKKEDDFYHVEHVYKFYLYDQTEGTNELDYWIGPNRKDCLNFKLDKLKNKQLPILQTDQGIQVLKDLNIPPDKVQQYVHFRAQLFTPKTKHVQFKAINPTAIAGYYYRLDELPTNYAYFLPCKLNWLLKPYENVEWKTFKEGVSEIKLLLSAQKSPMCWLKSNSGELEKCFVVWW